MSISIEEIKKQIKEYRKSQSFICEIKTTTACNMKCTYCYQKEKNNSVIDPEMVESLFDELAVYYDGPLVCCFHGGEPLLALDTIKTVIERQEQKAYFNRIVYTIQSNGTLLTKEILEYFSEKNVSLGLSIDADTDTGNACRRLHSGNSIEGIINSIIPEILKKMRGLSTTCVVTNNNISELENYIVWCYESGVDTVSLNFLRMSQEENSDKNLIPGIDEYIEVTKNLINKLIELNSKGEKKIYIYEISNLVNKILNPYYDRFICNSPCGAGKRIICLNTDGRIDRCDCMGDHPLNTMGYYKKGNLAEILELGKNDDFAVNKKNIRECRECEIEKYCPNGCASCNYIYYGKKDIDHPGMMCKWYKEIIPYLIELIDSDINLELLACE